MSGWTLTEDIFYWLKEGLKTPGKDKCSISFLIFNLRYFFRKVISSDN